MPIAGALDGPGHADGANTGPQRIGNSLLPDLDITLGDLEANVVAPLSDGGNAERANAGEGIAYDWLAFAWTMLVRKAKLNRLAEKRDRLLARVREPVIALVFPDVGHGLGRDRRFALVAVPGELPPGPKMPTKPPRIFVPDDAALDREIFGEELLDPGRAPATEEKMCGVRPGNAMSVRKKIATELRRFVAAITDDRFEFSRPLQAERDSVRWVGDDGID